MAAVVGSASGVTIKSGNLEATFDCSFAPTAFPKKEKAGLTLKLEGKLKTVDGTYIPAAKTISLDFDKNGELFTKGLPSCKQSEIESTLTAQAKNACGTPWSAPAESRPTSPSRNSLRSAPAARC